MAVAVKKNDQRNETFGSGMGDVYLMFKRQDLNDPSFISLCGFYWEGLFDPIGSFFMKHKLKERAEMKARLSAPRKVEIATANVAKMNSTTWGLWDGYYLDDAMEPGWAAKRHITNMEQIKWQ